MTFKKTRIVSFFQGLLLFLVFWTTKKPLVFLLDDASNDVIYVLGVLLVFLTFILSWILLRIGKLEAVIFQSVIMLIILTMAMSDGALFGVYKGFSIILMLNFMVMIYLLNRQAFNVEIILLTMAGCFLFYGIVSGLWLFVIGYDLKLRETIGFNGPIVFGQYMIISFTIYLLYGHKLKAPIAVSLSYLSLSKGPILGGFLAFYLDSKNKFKLAVISVPLLAASVSIFEFDSRAFSWLSLDSFESLLALSSVSSRVDAYVQGYHLLSESFMGLGWGGWSKISYLRYPHNIFLEILVEPPLLLGLFLLSFMCLVFYYIKDRRYRILLCVMLFMAQFSGSIVDNRGVFFISMLFSLVCPVFERRVKDL